MNNRQRSVGYFDLGVVSKVRGAAEAHARQVAVHDALHAAHMQWRHHGYVSKGAAIQVALTDWVIEPNGRRHHLLFNRADASLQDIPLVHYETGRRRMAGKERREGIDLSCHVLIQESALAPGPALLLMTTGSSLSSDKICQSLSSLFQRSKDYPANAAHFEREHPNGAAGATISLISHFVVGGHQNATLAHLLRGGRLEGVEFISEAAQELDADAALEITAVQYTLERARPGVIGLRTIMNAAASLRDRGVELSKARVRYKLPGSEKPESHTFLSIEALEAAFVRKEVIRFDEPIAARYERVEMRVMTRLAALADREN